MGSKYDLNALACCYKEQLESGKIQQAYAGLIGYVRELKAEISKKRPDFLYGNVSPGYMDYTYFPVVNEYLRENKLRFGIVLNHREVCFELWLMGQNALTQKTYWENLKTSKWNSGLSRMPLYSVLETIIIQTPDFNDLSGLTKEIEKKAFSEIEEIVEYLKKNQF